MPDVQALSAHVRRDTRLAYQYATLGTIQAVLGTAAIVVCLFVAPHRLVGLVVVPLAVAAFLMIGARPRRPVYRTRGWRLRPDMRDGSIPRRDALRIMAHDVSATPNRHRWGLQVVGFAQGAAAALTVYLSSGPIEMSAAVAALWLTSAAISIKLETMLFVSAMHILSLLDNPEVP